MSEIINPLQGIINQAALTKTKAKTVQQYAERLNPKNAAGTLLLLDISGSMVGWVGGYRKIDLLRRSLDRDLNSGETAIAFHSICELVADLRQIPEPQGGTALHLAIATGCQYRPSHSLIVSDGVPDDKAMAIAAAKKLTGTISTLYIGHGSNRTAIAFMQSLARLGCGRYDFCDLSQVEQVARLAQSIEQLRLPPAQN